MTIKKDCIATARQALNNFSEDELESYIKQVLGRTRELNELGVPFPRKAAIEEINKLQMETLLDDAASAARDINKFDEINFKMNSDVEIRSFLEKTSKNTDYNIETAGKAAIQLLDNQAFGKMNKEHLSTLEDGKIDDAVYSVADGQKHHDPMVTLIGDSLREYVPVRNAKLIQSDAMAPKNLHKDRFMRNMYDQSKISKIPRDIWVATHKSRINIKETFKDSRAVNAQGEIDDAIVNEMIGNTYDNIIEGNGAIFTKSSVARDSDIIERSRHMFYVYKDWKSWGMSNAEYGRGNLFKSWLSDIQTSGQQAGMAEIMGTNPKRMYLKMKHIQVKKEVPGTKSKHKHFMNDELFKNLLGEARGNFDPNMANIGASIRSLSSVARSGVLALLSIGDTANIAGFAQRAGVGYWQPLLNSILHLFDAIPHGESRIELAKMMSSSLRVHSGTVTRFSEITGLGDIVNRLSNKFFHGIGLHALDGGNKLSAMEPIMNAYGRQSSKAFKDLKPQQQSYLNRFNISEHEWEGIRSKTENNRLATDNVNRLSDDEIHELWNTTAKNIPLSMYRSTLYRKVFAMFDTAHEFSVLNGTAFTNMCTTGNFKAGTIAGEAWRAFGQFKAYPVQYFRRVWVGGLQDFDSYQAKSMFALNQALGTIMMAALAESLTSIAKGLTPPDPTKMSASEQARYFRRLLSGGLGVYGSTMNHPANAKEFIGAFFGTPSIKFAYDPLVAAFALADGDLDSAKSAVKDWAKVANPIATFPVASPFVDAFLGNKPYVEPGQHSIF